MTQTALDSYALANGFGKTTAAMTEAEKVALRYQFVQDQLSAAQGDFARTSDSWANQCRILSLQLQSLMATIGQGLINLFTPVIKVINTVIGKLATLANAFKSFTELITGNKSSGTDSGVSAIAGAAGDATEGLDSASDSASNLAGNTDKVGQAAQNAAKKMKALMGFDKINKLDSQSDTTSSGSSPSSDTGGTGSLGGTVNFGSLADGDTVIDKTNKSASKLAGLLKNIWKPFQEAGKAEGKSTIDSATFAFKNLGKLAKSVGKSIVSVWTNGTGATILKTMLRIAQDVLKTIGNIAKGFDDAWNKNSVGTQIIQNIVNALVVVLKFVEKIAEDTAKWAKNLDFYPLLESISSLTSTFAPILEAIGKVLEWVYNNIVLPMLKWVIETGLPTVINLVSGLANIFAEHQSVVEAFGAALIGAFAAVKIGEAVTSIIGFIATLAERISGLIALMSGSGGILGGVTAIATAIGPGGLVIAAIGAVIAAGVLLYKNWDKIKEVAGSVASAVAGFFETMGIGIAACFKDIRDTASGIWTEIQNLFAIFGRWLGNVFATDWSKNFGTLGKVLNTFLSGVKQMWNNAKKIFNGIVDFITGTFSGNWEQAWNGIADIFGGIFDSLITLAKTPLNMVIDIINSLMEKINSGLSAIESAFSFNYDFENPITHTRHTGHYGMSLPRVPEIPHLANGGYVKPNTPQLAMIGDNLHQGEVVAPEDKLKQMAIEAAMAAGSGGVSRDELESIINRAVMRIVSALTSMGFYLDSTQIANAQREAMTIMDIRNNTVEVR